MPNTMIEIISDDELIDLLIDTAHTTPTLSESNFLDVIREELKRRLLNHDECCPECGGETIGRCFDMSCPNYGG